ncbi:septum formation initiator, partial [Streptomyces sp. SID14478]|nr:septum formation initiator [Streptomyces sp. SID14478]
HLPSAWQGAAISCADDGTVMKATVRVDVPLFFPGVNPGWSVTGEAGAASEADQ